MGSEPLSVGTEPRGKAWLLCHRVHFWMSKFEEAMYASTGISPAQFYILTAIKVLGSKATLTEVAQWVGKNLNNIAMTVARMEKVGLLKKKRGQPDRRSVTLIMTEKSEEMFDQVWPVSQELVAKLMDSLSDEEVKVFSNLMRKLRNRAKAELGIQKEGPADTVKKRC